MSKSLPQKNLANQNCMANANPTKTALPFAGLPRLCFHKVSQ
ncbi:MULTISPECIES: hypothetical protein [unclassified Campylobacter]|nr:MULTISPECIES: hypothetical protein [unclassified Campylobacter]MDA3043495.1 hypothetical protein [Campylobacter sp. JMF_09 ED2]MDA3045249.1 hypothetical protein [Campylobacter sp. JMF_07 ED4]MDA3064151.1 hypothetical protein [Campylobacter sp. JMF_11 EL3]MDA3071977.1 hypothetical protein [Campylobacter sp. VBCF_03 NA9]MDA3075339.1 hypothetical protein [Campylobacter sp. JMF_05 ED3]